MCSKCKTFSHKDRSCPHNPHKPLVNRGCSKSIPLRPVPKPPMIFLTSTPSHPSPIYVSDPSPSNFILPPTSFHPINLNQALILSPRIEADDSKVLEIHENSLSPPPTPPAQGLVI